MTDAMKPSLSAAERRDLCRLLRGVMRGDAQQAFPASIVGHAVSLGLLSRCSDGLAARPEAKTFLRRAACEIDEAGYTGQHREIVAETVTVNDRLQAVRRNIAEQPLACLARLKDRKGAAFLPVAALDAGERLARDFERGQLQPRITARWEPQLQSRGKGERGRMADLSDTALAARMRVGKAADAMGPELAGVALDICCFGKGLELVERERGWPARSAKLMLRTALLSLARHYAPPAAARRSSHRWGADDYRPDL